MTQRQKVLETDSATAKFLYTIIKQLDLKSVSSIFTMMYKVSNIEPNRLIGTGLHLISRYPMAMPLACDILGFDNRWRAHPHRESSEGPKSPKWWTPLWTCRACFP